jgi:outer membrane protein assembly factor BamB
MTPRWKLFRGALVALAVTLPLGSLALADSVDPSMPRAVVVGAPRGAAPSERLDPRRTGRARTRLPSAPIEVWRRHVSGGIDAPPLVDAAGNIIVSLTMPEVVKLGPDAKEIWRARVGTSAAIAPPTLLSDRTIAVVTTAGVAWGLTPGGAHRWSTPLGVRGRDTDTAPLALADGGLLVAAANTLVEIDADGVIRARATLEDRAPGAPAPAPERAVGAIVDSPAGALVTTETGSVYRFRPPSPPRKIGGFGGTTRRGALLADDRTLLAVVDGRRIVALDLLTGTTHVRAGGMTFDNPAALGPTGLVLCTTPFGMLLGLDAAGNERVHVLLDKPVPSLDGGAFGTGASFFGTVELKPSPPPVVDPTGRVAFVRANGRAGVVSPEGRVEIASERVCPAPVAVVPAGEKRMLIACHDGGLWMYGE